MPKFIYFFKIKPEGTFGLEEQNMTVVPAGMETVTPELHLVHGKFIYPGTQTIGRKLEETLVESFMIGEYSAEIKDNILNITIEGSSNIEAEKGAVEAIHRFLMLLSFSARLSVPLTFEIIAAENDRGERVKILKYLGKFSVRWYNLNQMIESIKNSSEILNNVINNKTLERALEYYERGLILSSQAMKTESPHTISYFKQEAFLNYWKSITIIIGDPSKNSKEFQNKYKQYGIEKEFFQDKIMSIKKIRDDYDVAHMSEDYKFDEKQEPIARDATRHVIGKYIELLK